MLEPSGTQASAVEKARAFRAQYRVGQNSQSHAGTADQASNMSKLVRVRQEIEFLKPRLEEILTRATTHFNTRVPTDNIEETCDDDKTRSTYSGIAHKITRMHSINFRH